MRSVVCETCKKESWKLRRNPKEILEIENNTTGSSCRGAVVNEPD